MARLNDRRPRPGVSTGSPKTAMRGGAPAAVARLQRAAGNRAVGRALARKITVRKGSKLSSEGFADALKKNAKVPDWLRKSVTGKGGSLGLSGKLKPSKDKIWLFVESLEKAFAAGDWDITTARSTIKVTGKPGKQTWSQLVSPDLQKDEQIGSWMKVGPEAGDVEFSPTRLHSELPEVIYGWTSPREATSRSKERRNLIVIVTEIEVSAPNGKTKVFTPGGDNVAEAILHEISIHAGRIAGGQADVHDESSAVISELVDQVGDFFRDTDASGTGLKRSRLTEDILAFVATP